jgi:hypothetical protein
MKFGPIIDPTAGRLQPWEHWHQDIVPHRTLRNKELAIFMNNFINYL